MRSTKLYKILQKASVKTCIHAKKIIYIILALLIVGAACVVFTVYQEKIADPDLDDYHMGIPSTGEYEWRSHNPLISSIGFACLIGGASLSVWLLLMRGRKMAAEKRFEDSEEAEVEGEETTLT